jgi:hypothetical protein
MLGDRSERTAEHDCSGRTTFTTSVMGIAEVVAAAIARVELRLKTG